MITEWLLDNFKSLHNCQIPLSPLTVIAGTNSSGKSTLLQSILVITQTLQSRFKEQQLILNGELTRLGVARNVLHFDRPEERLYLGGVLAFLQRNADLLTESQPIKQITFQLQFSANAGATSSSFELSWSRFLHQRGEKRILIELERSLELQSPFDFQLVEVYPNNLLSNIDSIKNTQFLPTHYRLRKRVADEFLDEISRLSGSVASLDYRDDPIEAEFSSEISEETKSFLAKIKSGFEAGGYKQVSLANLSQCKTTGDVITIASEIRQEDNLLFNEFRKQLDSPLGRRALEEQAGDTIRIVPRRMPEEIRRGIEDFQRYFEKCVHYLGPLRDDPRVIYATPNNIEFRHVGLKGEFTAAMLNLYGNAQVKYPIPSDKSGKSVPQIGEAKLIDAVTSWLQHMGLADTLTVEERVNIGYELNVHQSNMKNNLSLTNVGVGVSQVLPTLVMCLLVEENSTLLIEQPELHLHPRVQSILGDFFLGLTYCGKQCIVETHSEHIINRLFLRIAQTGIDQENPTQLLEKIGVLFVEKIGTNSHFRRVIPNEYGVISDDQWPKGFLDQSMIEIQEKIKAAKEKRQRKRS